MALPTTNLTGHFDASDADNLFKNEGDSGTPVDGDTVLEWRDEGDGSFTTHLDRHTGTWTGPEWRQSTPLMKLPCLDFDGSADGLSSWQVDDVTPRPYGNFVTASALTLAVVVWPVSITATSSVLEDNHFLLGDLDGSCALSFRDVSGTPKLSGWVYDGAYKSVDLTVATGRTWIAVLVFGGGTVTVYAIDDTGTETSDSVATGNLATTTKQMAVGHGPGAGRLIGRVGEFVVYNAALGGSDLTDLKNYFKDKWLTLGGGGGGIVRQMLQHHHRSKPRRDPAFRRHESGLYLRAA